MNFPSPEFDDAIDALFHGTIGDDTLEELHELLRANESAQDEYLWRVELHSELASGHLGFGESANPIETPRSDARPTCRARSNGRRNRFPAILNVVLLLLIMLGGWMWWSYSPLESPAPVEMVARITALEDCQWGGSTPAYRLGDAVRREQRLHLLSGSVELEFASRARAKIIGPTIFEPHSGNSAFLLQGQIQLEAETSESKGFVVQTPTSQFVDIGTAFTATVSPDGLSRLDVSDGEVDVVLSGVESSPRIRAGEAMCIEPGERQVMTRIEQGGGTAAFRFPTIEPPSSEDYADHASGRADIRVVQGQLRTRLRQSGPATVLLDGSGQSRQDDPSESAFFETNSGGSFLVDLGQQVSVTKINSYSWHQHETLEEHRHRAIQRFTLYGFSGDQLPDMTLPPHRAGWERIARVNTDQFFDVHQPLERPAQQACSITAAHGEIGRFRYLLWEIDGGTFFGEFDVFGEP